MKRLLALLLCLCFCIPALAESNADVFDYVTDLGFEITETWETPGWRTCYLLETEESQTLTFSDDKNCYAIVAGPLITIPFNESELRDLFLDLVSTFAWDVSFFGPDSDVNDKFVLSYGIQKDLDCTEQNFDDQTEYVAALNDWLTADKEAAWQALYDKIDSWNVPEIQTSSLTDCLTEVLGTRPLSQLETDQSLKACAVFYLYPDCALVGPGGNSPTFAKFTYPDLTELSSIELWGVCGSIIEYLYEHSADILADGLELSDGDVASNAAICIYGEPYIHVCLYDLVNHTATLTTADN